VKLMKVAVVYNRESKNVINLFGVPNQEKIGKKTIRRVAEALKQGGHQVVALEGDKDLVVRLEQFMPRVLKGERPGLVFNISYGIQGQARYTHVPSILEMIGVPYVASGPLAHSLSLDKVVTKMILRQHELPTPEFLVMDAPDAELPELPYPMIVKPKSEAVSFGLSVVRDEDELREGAAVIFDEFRQPVLVEQYIEGREINVGVVGNSPPEAFPPVELIFPGDGPRIYTYGDKTGRSGRTISHECPAPIGEKLQCRAQEIAVKAFQALGCADCARVDMRLDARGNLYILEINSLPSLGEHGSFLIGAEHIGLDYAGMVNRLVEVASARYFGTPEPPHLDREGRDPANRVFSYLTQRRDDLERRLREWTGLSSRTSDPLGAREALNRARKLFDDLGMNPLPELTDDRAAWSWETRAGLNKGTLLIAHLDVPGGLAHAATQFRRESEWLYGEGIGSSRAPLVMLEYALRALRRLRRLKSTKLCVLLYTDEGRDARYSAKTIAAAAARASRVLVLRPGNVGDSMIVQRRGQRVYRLRAEGEPVRPGRAGKKPEVLRWTWNHLEAFSRLSSRKERTSVSAVDLEVETVPMLLPHRVSARLLVTYPERALAEDLEQKMRSILTKGGIRWELELISDRPPMKERRGGQRLLRSLIQVAGRWEIPLKRESSVWPSVAGLVPARTACLCGVGPVARDLGTPQEAVQRISLIQRTLLLAQFLLAREERRPGARAGKEG
jgi:D-alanine-D-alanine ligase